MQWPGKVFITGANGFIGRALMTHFRASGAQVCGVDQVPDPEWNVVAGDIARSGEWQKQAWGCDLVIHTAAVVSNTAAADLYRAVSIAGVRQVVDAAVRGGVERMVHLSSITAYGLDFSSDRDETAPITALSNCPYCDAKAASEHVALAAHASGELECAIVRPGDVYGPGSRPWVTIPLELIRRRQFMLPAHGQGIFSPVYVDNLIDGIVAAATRSEAAGQIFNLTDGQGVSCYDFFSHHYHWLGRGKPVTVSTPLAMALTRGAGWFYRRVLQRPTELSAASVAMLSRRATYSIDKAARLLDYEPAVGLEQGMEQTHRWVREQGLLS